MSKPVRSDDLPGKRDTRYQGAIVREGHILLIKGMDHLKIRSFWLLPGGGMIAGETEQECVRREMLEETLLKVRVERLLMSEPAPINTYYQSLKTYLCVPISGSEGPGAEPELEELDAGYSIVDVGWFDLRDESGWGKELTSDEITYSQLKQIGAVLGYRSD